MTSCSSVAEQKAAALRVLQQVAASGSTAAALVRQRASDTVTMTKSAASVMKATVQDVQERAAKVSEGVNKIQEGKKLIEEGISK